MGPGLLQDVLDGFCLWNSVEAVIIYHEVTDDFSDFSYLTLSIVEEGAAGPYLNYHIFYGYTWARNRSTENPNWNEWVLKSL